MQSKDYQSITNKTSIEDFQLASFFRRIIAFIIDIILVGIIFISTYRFLVPKIIIIIEDILVLDDIRFLFILLHILLLIIITIVYHTFLECTKYQGSVGKILLKIKIVNQFGQKNSTRQSLLRNFSKMLSFGIGTIGFIIALFTAKRQTLHDLIAKTYVVKN